MRDKDRQGRTGKMLEMLPEIQAQKKKEQKKIQYNMKIKFDIKVKAWKEEDSYIVYSKKYDISGYGKTKKRAVKMFNFEIDSILMYTKSNKK